MISLDDSYPTMRDAAVAIDPGHMGAPDEPILLLYTSGTTGLPKGVTLTNRNMSYTWRLATESWGMSEASVNLVAMPLFHIGGCGYGSSTMMAGGHTVLMRDVDCDLAIDLMQKHRVTHAFFVPTVVQGLLRVEGVEDADLSTMELLMYGAAPIGDVLLSKAMKVFDCNFMHAYGMTEAAGTVVTLRPEDHALEGDKAKLLKSCGRPLPWVDLRIIDPETDEDAAPGKPGEIWLRSEMITPGYWQNPSATQEAITQDGWFRTGDAAYRDADGYVFLFDRFKDMIISGGENIYPAEIENALNAHDGIAECGVIGVPHEKWGETPLAVIVPKAGADLSEAEIIEFCRNRIARYKCPTRVAFVEQPAAQCLRQAAKAHPERAISGASRCVIRCPRPMHGTFCAAGWWIISTATTLPPAPISSRRITRCASGIRCLPDATQSGFRRWISRCRPFPASP